MICTFCGRGHTAAACPTRPRPSRSGLFLCAVLCAGLAACSEKPDVPPSRLDDPPAALMEDPEKLEPIPACDGAVDCRTRYYARTRTQYADLAGRHRGLQRWVRVGQPK